MANPEHRPSLDGFDRLTVRLYRTGLGIATAGVALLAVLCAVSWPTRPAVAVVLVGVLLSILDMHLYDKRVRWVIAASGLLGAVLVFAGGSQLVVVQAGLGFLFVALSGFALKEQFCFKIPGLRLVPLFLALGLLPLVFEVPVAAALLYSLATLPLAVLVFQKSRMPLDFDIGDKSRYQI